MIQLVVRCLLINAAGVLVSGALLWLYPKSSGFTVTVPSGTHYIGGGVLLSAMLECLLGLGVGIYLAWLLFHPR